MRHAILSAGLVLIATIATSAAAQPISEISKTIGLKCPSENGGTLEHSEVSRDGMSYRQQLTYIDSQPAILVRAEARTGAPFGVIATIDLRTDNPDPVDQLFNEIVVQRLLTIVERVCSGTAESRAQFLEQIRANRTSLGLP